MSTISQEWLDENLICVDNHLDDFDYENRMFVVWISRMIEWADIYILSS
jgi:hypothetical protein